MALPVTFRSVCHGRSHGCALFSRHDDLRVRQHRRKATTSRHASTRVATAKCLSQFGREAREAVPALLRLLRDSEQSVRLSSLKALQSIGPGAKESVPLVVEFLRSPHDSERAAAARAMGAVRGDAEIVIPVLLESLTDGKNYLPPNSNRDVFIDDHICYETAPIHYVVSSCDRTLESERRVGGSVGYPLGHSSS